jgi:putative ABC transport system permease protein
VRLALIQFRRAPIRTALLVFVVGILVFLVEFLATISATLQVFNTGALRHLGAGVFIYAGAADGSLDASRLPARLQAVAERVSGVATVAPIGVADFTATGPAGRYELLLLGAGPGPAGQPVVPVTGRLPAAGELLADSTESTAGLGLGHQVTLAPGGLSLRVVGVATGIRYDGLVTAWTTFGSWAQAVRSANPGGVVSANALAVQAKPGTPAGMLVRSLSAALPGAQVLTRAEAVADVPGAGVISATFDLLIAAAFIAAVLVVGSVFLLITVQRSRPWVLVRALGAPVGRLGVVVLIQAAIVVVAASALASIGLTVVGTVAGAAFPVRAAPTLQLWTAMAALAGAGLSSLLPIRRIGRIDPGAAMVRA